MIHTYKTDKEMIELVLKNLGLEYECKNGEVIKLINDGSANQRKVCSHEEIVFEFDSNGKFECIATY